MLQRARHILRRTSKFRKLRIRISNFGIQIQSPIQIRPLATELRLIPKYFQSNSETLPRFLTVRRSEAVSEIGISELKKSSEDFVQDNMLPVRPSEDMLCPA